MGGAGIRFEPYMSLKSPPKQKKSKLRQSFVPMLQSPSSSPSSPSPLSPPSFHPFRVISCPPEQKKSNFRQSFVPILQSPSSSSSPPLPLSPSSSPSSFYPSRVVPCPPEQIEPNLLSSSVSPSVLQSPNTNEIVRKKKPDKAKTETSRKNTVVEEDEAGQSLINLTSIVSQHFTKQQEQRPINTDDSFAHIVVHQLELIGEPRKTEIKGKILKLLFDF